MSFISHAFHTKPLNEVLRQQGRLPHGAIESVPEVECFKGYADAMVHLKPTLIENESQLATTL